jgi:ribokinase
LKKDGVDVSCIRVVEKTPTGTAVIVVVDGDKQIILDKGANNCLRKEDIDKALEKAEKGDIYLTQLENPIAVIGYGLQKAKEKGLFVVLNPAPANLEILPYLQYCDLLTHNETEVELLGGRERLLDKVQTLLVTLGGDGFEICDKQGAKRYPCIKITAVDTTAAGDTLCGGLVAMLSKGETLEDSAKFGSLSASIACTRKGAQPSIPTESEVLAFQ